MILRRELYQRHGYIKGFFVVLLLHLGRLFHFSFGYNGPFFSSLQDDKLETNERYRGMLALTVKEDSSLQCDSCGLCQDYCPADCIHIVPGKNTGPPKAFEIELLRCVFCGFCEEACPIDAIRLTSEVPKAGHAEQDWMVGINELAFRKSLNGGQGLRSRFVPKKKKALEKKFKRRSLEL
jgi:NADH-quinone oxidoreductase subunit I